MLLRACHRCVLKACRLSLSAVEGRAVIRVERALRGEGLLQLVNLSVCLSVLRQLASLKNWRSTVTVRPPPLNTSLRPAMHSVLPGLTG